MRQSGLTWTSDRRDLLRSACAASPPSACSSPVPLCTAEDTPSAAKAQVLGQVSQRLHEGLRPAEQRRGVLGRQLMVLQHKHRLMMHLYAQHLGEEAQCPGRKLQHGCCGCFSLGQGPGVQPAFGRRPAAHSKNLLMLMLCPWKFGSHPWSARRPEPRMRELTAGVVGRGCTWVGSTPMVTLAGWRTGRGVCGGAGGAAGSTAPAGFAAPG